MNSRAIGRKGELLFAERMSANGYTVEDVSGNSDYWALDIDFLITSPTSGATKSFEVKYDTRINKTGNLFLETESINSKQWNYGGWYNHTKADYLVYGDAVTEVFYVIPLLELKQRVAQLPPRIAHCGAESTGLLISLNDIKDIIKIV